MAVSTRIERDPLGELTVPADAYYGIQTERASANFPISGFRAHPELVTATILVKKAAAETNVALGRLPADVASAIVAACDEILGGGFRDQFIVDVYQAGAGTSHNMNANEVLANRAGERLGEPLGTYARVHPNDHVNMGQSTNDVFPTATRLALLLGSGPLVHAARQLAESLSRKAEEFGDALKTGRTHLQDAVPITFAQEFGGYGACIRRGADDVAAAAEQLQELNIGATAVGTGLNAGEEYRKRVVDNLARYTGLPLKPAHNLFRVTQSMGDVLAYSGAMRRLAVELGKVANDLRLLSMGPARRYRRNRPAGGSTGFINHAGQGEPVHSGDGQSGVLPGDGVRYDGGHRERSGAARIERHDAGHRLERVARLVNPPEFDDRPPPADDRRTRRRHRASA
jgi:aspartate ammonia-lyase